MRAAVGRRTNQMDTVRAAGTARKCTLGFPGGGKYAEGAPTSMSNRAGRRSQADDGAARGRTPSDSNIRIAACRTTTLCSVFSPVR
jgi:hypothetical protein